MFIAQFILGIFELIQYPPGSAIFIFGLAILTAVVSNLITRIITDTAQIKRLNKQIRLHKQSLKKAEKEGDTKKVIQLKRKNKYIQKITGRIAKERIKPLVFTFAPLIIVFFLLNGFFNPGTAILVAYTPFRLGSVPLIGTLIGTFDSTGYGLYFVFWYMICNFGLSTIIGRALGSSGE
jgi:uncharacterized membrane protein (DUF106 family)